MDIRAMIDPPSTTLPHDPSRSPPNLLPALSSHFDSRQSTPSAASLPLNAIFPQEQQRPTTKDRAQRRSTDKANKACKTCLYCRKRKTKCNSLRPSCEACAKLDRPCIYPEDSRRLARPSVKEYQEIKQEYQEMAKKVAKIDGVRPTSQTPRPSSPGNNRSRPREPSASFSSPYYNPGSGLKRTSSGSMASFRPATPYDNWVQHDGSQSAPRHRAVDDRAAYRSLSCPVEEPMDLRDTRRDTAVESMDVLGIAGRRSITSDPSYSQLELLRDPLTPPRKYTPALDPLSKMPLEIDRDVRTTLNGTGSNRHRLVANANTIKQRETKTLRSEAGIKNGDLDGVDSELAIHLLDLHWDGPHLSNLISYRPIIVESLLRNGPHCNKLLLNAIFFSSAVLSDRPQLQSDPVLPGQAYYHKFRRLLTHEMDRPKIPTAVGSLLCGATLITWGHTSAGWMLCGIAYRMIEELGCLAAVTGQSRRRLGDPSSIATELEVEARKRLFYAAYITDSHHSLYYGRFPALQLPAEELCHGYHDSFEETEEYIPYDDPHHPKLFSLYEPRPAYAVSTAEAMVRLSRVSTNLARRLYNVDTLYHSSEQIVALMKATQSELDGWQDSLPQHLRFDPETDSTPAPHHMTPLLLFSALRILLHRPFVPSGPFDAHVARSVTAGLLNPDASEAVCINAARSIKDIVEAYKAAFSLRSAPFIVTYCIYAAVVALLSTRAKHRSRQQLTFFWTTLQDCREGSNKSLGKPAAIIRELTYYCKNNGADGLPKMQTSPKQSDAVIFAHNLDPSLADARPRSISDLSGGRIDVRDSDRMDYTGISSATPSLTQSESTRGSAATTTPMFASSYWPCNAADWPLDDPLYGLLNPDYTST